MPTKRTAIIGDPLIFDGRIIEMASGDIKPSIDVPVDPQIDINVITSFFFPHLGHFSTLALPGIISFQYLRFNLILRYKSLEAASNQLLIFIYHPSAKSKSSLAIY